MKDITTWRPRLRDVILGMNARELAAFLRNEQTKVFDTGQVDTEDEIYARLQQEYFKEEELLPV